MAKPIIVSKNAHTAITSLPVSVQRKFNRLIEQLSAGQLPNEANRLKTGELMYSLQISPIYRVILQEKNDAISIIDVINYDSVKQALNASMHS